MTTFVGSAVYTLVEAALLDSSGNPESEVRMALEAVAHFALRECDARPEALHRMLDVVLGDVCAELESVPFDELPLAGVFCSVCLQPQRRTSQGLSCPDGHGGAPGTTLGYEGDELAFALAAALPVEELLGGVPVDTAASGRERLLELARAAGPLPSSLLAVPASFADVVAPARKAPPVEGFNGRHRFLSNFEPVDVVLDGVTYHSVEAAYQAAKTLDGKQRAKFATASASDAKRMGRRLKLRADWEEVKLGVMEDLLRQKFSRDPLRAQLLATGDAELVEVNYWGDVFWGVCQGVGENWLGRLLMKVRAEIGGSS